MKNSLIVIGVILGSLAFLGLFPNEPIQEPIQTQSTQATENYATLEMPDINFRDELVKAEIVGKEFAVPDTKAAIYESNDNIFIYGHNTSVFSRLSEAPRTLSLTKDGVTTTYTLKSHQTRSLSEISMGNILSYNGVVLMTCAGENNEFRLVLYYIEG